MVVVIYPSFVFMVINLSVSVLKGGKVIAQTRSGKDFGFDYENVFWVVSRFCEQFYFSNWGIAKNPLELF